MNFDKVLTIKVWAQSWYKGYKNKNQTWVFNGLGHSLGHIEALGHKNYDFRLVFSGENVFDSIGFLA